MFHSVLTILRQTRERNSRAVVLVPETGYLSALKVLVGLYEQNSGRTARMPNGHLVTVLTPSMPLDTVTEDFDLYLSGWGNATRLEETALRSWTLKAKVVHTVLS